MNSRWIIIILFSLFLQIATADIMTFNKKEKIPQDSKVFIEINEEIDQVSHSRQRRVGPEPPKKIITIKDDVNSTTSSTIMNKSTNINESSASEANDMEQTSKNHEYSVSTISILTKNNFTDDDNSTKHEIVNNTTEQITTTTTTVLPMKNNEVNVSTSEAAKIFPKNGSKSLDQLDLKLQEKLKHTEYNVTDSDETNVTVTPVTIKPLYEPFYSDSSVMESTTTTTTIITDPVNRKLQSREEIVEEAKNDKIQDNKNEKTGMPIGIVALIITIAFATVVVIGYIGLIAWKRYLEYRYGTRELLVNDFDANDINNFEL